MYANPTRRSVKHPGGLKGNRRTIAALLFVLLFTTGPSLAARVEYVIGIDGLSCPFCAYGVEKKLKALEGVESVSVDLNKGHAVVIAPEPLKVKKIREAVEDAGFSVSWLEERPLGPEDKK